MVVHDIDKKTQNVVGALAVTCFEKIGVVKKKMVWLFPSNPCDHDSWSMTFYPSPEVAQRIGLEHRSGVVIRKAAPTPETAVAICSPELPSTNVVAPTAVQYGIDAGKLGAKSLSL